MNKRLEIFTDVWWMAQIIDAVGFFVKAVMIIVLALIFISILVQILRGDRQKQKRKMEVEDLGRHLESYLLQVKKVVLGKKTFDRFFKSMKKKRKDMEARNVHGPVVFVIDFEGDVRASQVENLREEISTVLSAADPKKDEVIVRVESRGGAVYGYGLAASQLQRIRDRNLPLTVCVDKIAASGGYMMACVANKILAAPFAILGSIGVISMVPNLHRFLKKHDVDYEEMTAGEFKRTVSIFGEISEKAKNKHLRDLEDMHLLFKEHVQKYRPSLDIKKVATGEYWYGLRAKELHLVDRLQASDDYISELLKDNKKVCKVKLKVKKSFIENLKDSKSDSDSLVQKILRLQSKPYETQLPTDFPPNHFI